MNTSYCQSLAEQLVEQLDIMGNFSMHLTSMRRIHIIHHILVSNPGAYCVLHTYVGSIVTFARKIIAKLSLKSFKLRWIIEKLH